jgi:ribonuclease-3
MDIDKCEVKLGVVFRDKSLLLQALVHGSYINETHGNQSDSNERMEFLGDAVLGMVMAEKLYASLPSEAEGTLTSVRASVVRRESLARAARSLALGECLLLGRGEEATGGRDKDRNLAGAFEAVVGAIHLDQGYPVARTFVLRHLGTQLDDALLSGSPPNYKALLQECLQNRDEPLPQYQLVSTGPAHNKRFTAVVFLRGEAIGQGTGHSKKTAETAAAQCAWAALRSREV